MKLEKWLYLVYNNENVDIKERFKTDNTLQDFVNVTYSDEYKNLISTMPKFKQYQYGIGYEPSNIHMNKRRIMRSFFDEKLTTSQRYDLLARICESLGEYENKFLSEVISGEISFLPKRLWEKYNAIV
jgi:hypothetical protein